MRRRELSAIGLLPHICKRYEQATPIDDDCCVSVHVANKRVGDVQARRSTTISHQSIPAVSYVTAIQLAESFMLKNSRRLRLMLCFRTADVWRRRKQPRWILTTGFTRIKAQVLNLHGKNTPCGLLASLCLCLQVVSAGAAAAPAAELCVLYLLLHLQTMPD